MKLHFIEALIGPMRKQLGMDDGLDHTYPNAARVTSFEEEVEVSKDGLQKYRDLLVEHAKPGHALLKGLLDGPLMRERRKGRIASDQDTQLLVLDVDGLQLNGIKSTAMGQDTVRSVAEQVIAMMPEELRSVSYVAVASSSFGMSETKVSVHIHMMLQQKVNARTLRSWLKSLNFNRDQIYAKLQLADAKLSIKSVIDPCLAEPTRVIYIAPPHFGPNAKNPFPDDEDRIVLVEKMNTALDISPLLGQMADLQGKTEEREREKLVELQKAAGVSTKKRKKTKIVIGKETHWVVSEPEKAILTIHSEDDEFVRYNMPGGKSGAYWVRKDNPEVLFSFKPEVSPQLFREVDSTAYDNHVRRFGEGHTTENVLGQNRKVRHHMFIDQNTDSFHIMSYDFENDVLVELVTKTQTTAEQFMLYKGALVPDPVPTWYIDFDPSKTDTMIVDGDKVIINRFQPSEYMVNSDVPHPLAGEVGYGEAWLVLAYCPTIYSIIYHMLGNDDECFEHFMNWVAFIFQRREKTKTGWLAHGTQGTGKGLFYHRIIRPLMGEHHARQNTLQRLVDDDFNGWMQHCLFLMIDEFNLENASSNTVRTANEIKTMVTEPTFMMRKMRREQVQVDQYLNFFLGTNDVGALSFEDKRRFNVAPRQNIMLNQRLPHVDQQEYFDSILDAELKDFAAFLHGYKVNVPKAHTILQNEAKKEASRAGMDSASSFFQILRKGDFESLAEILDKPEHGLKPDHLMHLKQVKDLLRKMLPYVNSGRATYLMREDLKAIYSLLAGKDLSDNAFGRMLNKQELPTVRRHDPLGIPDGVKLSSRPRCIEVTWAMEDEVTLADLKKHNLREPESQQQTSERKTATSW